MYNVVCLFVLWILCAASHCMASREPVKIFCNFDTTQKCTLPAVAYFDAYQHGYCARCINVHVNFLSGACGRRLAKMQMAIMMAAAAGRAHFF